MWNRKLIGTDTEFNIKTYGSIKLKDFKMKHYFNLEYHFITLLHLHIRKKKREGETNKKWSIGHENSF